MNFRLWLQFYQYVCLDGEPSAGRSLCFGMHFEQQSALWLRWLTMWRRLISSSCGGNVVPPYSLELGLGLAQLLRSMMTIEICMQMILSPTCPNARTRNEQDEMKCTQWVQWFKGCISMVEHKVNQHQCVTHGSLVCDWSLTPTIGTQPHPGDAGQVCAPKSTWEPSASLQGRCTLCEVHRQGRVTHPLP